MIPVLTAELAAIDFAFSETLSKNDLPSSCSALANLLNELTIDNKRLTRLP